MCQGVPLVKGQFCAPIVGYFQFFEKYLHSDTCLCTAGVDMTKLAGVTKIIKD